MYYGLYYKGSLKITIFIVNKLIYYIPMEMNGTIAQVQKQLGQNDIDVHVQDGQEKLEVH